MQAISTSKQNLNQTRLLCPMIARFKSKNIVISLQSLGLKVFISIFTTCTTFHRYPIFSTRYSVMCKVYTGYCGTGEIEHGLCACTVDNPLAKARELSLRTGAQPTLYLPHVSHITTGKFLGLQRKHIAYLVLLLPCLMHITGAINSSRRLKKCRLHSVLLSKPPRSRLLCKCLLC